MIVIYLEHIYKCTHKIFIEKYISEGTGVKNQRGRSKTPQEITKVMNLKLKMTEIIPVYVALRLNVMFDNSPLQILFIYL